jgi:hypothetical protein
MLIVFSFHSQLVPKASAATSTSREKSVDDLTGLMSNLKTQEVKEKGKTENEPLNSSLPTGEAQRMIHAVADLHLFDQKSNAFVPKVTNTDVRLVQIGPYKCKYTLPSHTPSHTPFL